MSPAGVIDWAKYRRAAGLPEFQRDRSDPTALVARKLGPLVWSHVRRDAQQVPELCWRWRGEFLFGHPVVYLSSRPIPAVVVFWRLLRPEMLHDSWLERETERCGDPECANPWHYGRRPKTWRHQRRPKPR